MSLADDETVGWPAWVITFLISAEGESDYSKQQIRKCICKNGPLELTKQREGTAICPLA